MTSQSQTNSINRQLAVRDDHWCFGCGRQNPIGLQLTFFDDGDAVSAPWTPLRQHQGYQGIVHGGLITTVLDEVMSWAIYTRKLWAVTASINVRFRKPLHVGESVTARARVTTVSGRKVDVRAELVRDSDGQSLAEATALFIRVSEEQAAEWQGRYINEAQPND